MSPFTRLKASLGAMYAKFGCAVLFFEVGRLSMKGGHAHVQAVPIPLRLKEKIEETFLREGRAQGIDFEEDPDAAMASCANGKGSYFKVDLPDGRKMVHLLKDRIPFSIQFGRYGNIPYCNHSPLNNNCFLLNSRQVLVGLLGTPNRLDWKACMLSEEEDRADAQAFKNAFAPFNPSL